VWQAGTESAKGVSEVKEASFGEACVAIYPERVALVTSVTRDEKANVMTVGWYSHASGEPPMVTVAISRRAWTNELLRRVPEMGVCFPAADMGEGARYAGTHSGREGDKFGPAGFTRVASRRIRPPLIEGCAAALECRVAKMVEAGDHTIFVGEVLASYVRDEPAPVLLTVGRGYKFSHFEEPER